MQLAGGIVIQTEQHGGPFRKFEGTGIDRRTGREPAFDIVAHLRFNPSQDFIRGKAVRMSEGDVALEILPENLEIRDLRANLARLDQFSGSAHGTSADG